jgi:hypothetical protein
MIAMHEQMRMLSNPSHFCINSWDVRQALRRSGVGGWGGRVISTWLATIGEMNLNRTRGIQATMSTCGSKGGASKLSRQRLFTMMMAKYFPQASMLIIFSDINIQWRLIGCMSLCSCLTPPLCGHIITKNGVRDHMIPWFPYDPQD